MSQINSIIIVVTEGGNTSVQRHSVAEKSDWTGNVVTDSGATIESDHQLTV
jgi:hypothetical protein